jgi:prepilin-type N-terminal cleavage/methylation domain-containing protein
VQGATQRRGGFTLVELIVVIVILGILLAIAIPALTGYVRKAQDKDWEMRARDTVAAVRTVIDAAYADGTLGSGASMPVDYLENGHAGHRAADSQKWWEIHVLSFYDTGNSFTYFNDARELMGIPKLTLTGNLVHEGIGFAPFIVYLLAPDSPEYNIFNAPAFIVRYNLSNRGFNDNWIDPGVVVTYGIGGLGDGYVGFYASGAPNTVDGALKTLKGSAFDASAGYRVFHVENVQ